MDKKNTYQNCSLNHIFGNCYREQLKMYLFLELFSLCTFRSFIVHIFRLLLILGPRGKIGETTG